MPPPPPPLPDELLEEILLRLPPEDPGCLFRASLVCKPWRSRLTGSAFPRLYREFHGTPPLLGFFENDDTVFCWFTPLSPTSPFLPVHPDHRDLFVLDSRHGRVLLNSVGPDGEPLGLIVWDPVGRRKWGLPYPEFADWVTVPDNAAVLCAVDGCDHLDCHGGPFLVVYVGTDEDGVAHACVYSSDSCAWSPVTSCEHPESFLEVIICWPKAHVGDAVYFSCTSSKIILRYDLFTQELSMITWPAMYKWQNANHILMRTEDGVLGCASLQESRLEVWLMKSGTDGAVKWVLSKVLELDNWLQFRFSYLTRFADGVGVFFVRTNLGIFTVELKSGRVRKISNSKDQVIPYMSFYTPDQSGGIKPPSTLASSSEIVETTRGEQHDLLLQHSSGEVGDVKEKWVEKGEEDCEWKEGGWHEEGSVEDWEWKGEKAAVELFEKGSKAIEEGHFVDAKDFLHRALKSWVLYCGRLSPMCVSTYYKYGIALLRKAQAKIAPHHQHVVEGSAIRDNTGSSKASGSNVREGDTGKDLDLAWKMLNIARAILEKSPCIPMEKVLTFCALAEVSMEREDIDYSLRACVKALAILEHLVEPDHCRIVLLNLQIFLALKSASKIRDALPYARKVSLLYKSRLQKLIRANKALMAVTGDNASAAEFGSEMSSLDNEIEVFSSISTVLEEKVIKSVFHLMNLPVQ
ncbi:hypothetical protein QYE76_044930 [Lolium multiflorum]|uniref:F-box domain-containing protein n=1 Tax=Lolium multiflorum TaxID=4521 RepID=A0AAD8TLX4_LOLMU|nr:hypothetical protein QYE76_044930 [Lolium multiflorum]